MPISQGKEISQPQRETNRNLAHNIQDWVRLFLKKHPELIVPIGSGLQSGDI